MSFKSKMSFCNKKIKPNSKRMVYIIFVKEKLKRQLNYLRPICRQIKIPKKMQRFEEF